MEALLQAQLAGAAQARDRLAEEVKNFRVLPAFRDLEVELARLSIQDRELSDSDVIDHELMSAHELALAVETAPTPPDLLRLFEDAKIAIPELVQRRYDEVQKFHEALGVHRRSYLMAERSAAEARIASRNKQRQIIQGPSSGDSPGVV